MSEQDALNIIRETISSPVKPLALYLFGSRSQGMARPDSDYDLLVVVDEPASLRDRITLSSKWRGQLARKGLDADILVKTPFEIEEYRTKIGSLIHDALRTGIAL
jgi:predicted nucleotidyltransferase